MIPKKPAPDLIRVGTRLQKKIMLNKKLEMIPGQFDRIMVSGQPPMGIANQRRTLRVVV